MIRGPFIFVIVVSVLLYAYIVYNSENWQGSQPSSPDQKFEVVDRYDNRCDVVQYTPTNAARYTYFLDCKK
jgi:hypothetical protein